MATVSSRNLQTNERQDGNDYDSAIADYTEAIRLGSNDVATWANMTAAWEAKNEHDKAITYLDEAIRLGPNNQKVVKRKSLVMQKRQ